MKLYKQEITIGNEKKLMVVANYEKEKSEESVTVDRLHHIHVIDRSGSMWSDINNLIDNVQTTIDTMADNDLISVVWFSGEGQGDILLKGASKSDDVKKIVDTLRSTVGCTCFSEPLEKVNKIIDDLYILCPNISVTFFTDGETVTNHSEAEEEDRIFKQLDKIKDKIMAFNTIGYGNYYNKKLLEEMSAKSEFGRHIHSKEIKEYSEIFSHNYKILSDMVCEKVNVRGNGDIIYLSSKDCKMSNLELQLSFLNKIKNQFAIICELNDESVTINDTEYKLNEITKKVPKSTINNILYTYAYELYYKGNTSLAIDILANNLKDKFAVDSLINAFTFEERQEAQDIIKEMIFKNKERLKEGECSDNYIPSKDAFCVMDLFKILMEGNNFYVPVKEYNRIGLKVKDTFNLFKENEGQNEVPFKDFVFNSKHLNLSIRYDRKGKVSLNPKQAKKVGLEEEIDSKIYRNQTIIKDGNLNIEKFNAYIDRDTMTRILEKRPEALKDLITIIESANGNGEFYVIIDLSVLPVINRLYAEKDDIQEVLDIVRDIQIDKAYQKVLNYYIDKKKPENLTFEVKDKTFNSEQIEVLQEHGLNAKLEYQGVNNKVSEKNENDFYESRALELYIDGAKSLPKVEEVKTKMLKKPNLGVIAMNDAINMVENDNLSYEEIKEELVQCKNHILQLNMELNTLKMAKVLTGSWWSGLTEGNRGTYNYSDENNTLVIKSSRVKIFY